MTGPETPETAEVCLLRVPLAVHGRAQEHGEELFREFTLISQEYRESGGRDEHVPTRLMQLIEEITASYGTLGQEQEQQVADAMAAGESELPRLVFRVPVTAASDIRRLAEMLDQADQYCRDGALLLTLATPDESLRYRRWYLGEFLRQIEGAAPTAWPDFAG
jgi:hypothetical protein